MGAVSALTPPAPPSLKSVLKVGDESVAPQLLKGFFESETGDWRWTAPAFTARLAVPPGAREKGGILRLSFNLPPPLIAQHPKITVSAKVNDLAISKKFSGVGAQKLELEIASTALSDDSVLAEFSVDQPFAPGGTDTRSLGVIAVSLELVAKQSG